jgi:large subunit ribosomal protein L31
LKQHLNLHLVDVRCLSCGTSFTVRSTAETISVDVCAGCHPAYTGIARTLANGGRIERFNRRRALAAA